MDVTELVKLAIDGGLGAMSLALFFRLGQVVANHEIRITKLEDDDVVRPRRKRRSKSR